MSPTTFRYKDELGVAQIIGVVDLSPDFPIQSLCMNLGLLHINKYSKNQFIIAVIVDDTTIVAEQSAEGRPAKVSGELVDVQSLVLVREIEARTLKRARDDLSDHV